MIVFILCLFYVCSSYTDEISKTEETISTNKGRCALLLVPTFVLVLVLFLLLLIFSFFFFFFFFFLLLLFNHLVLILVLGIAIAIAIALALDLVLALAAAVALDLVLVLVLLLVLILILILWLSPKSSWKPYKMNNSTIKHCFHIIFETLNTDLFSFLFNYFP